MNTSSSIGSLLLGFIMQMVNIVLTRSDKDLFGLIIYAILTMALSMLGIANPIAVLFQYGVITALLLVLTLNLSRWTFEPWPMLRFRERAVR